MEWSFWLKKISLAALEVVMTTSSAVSDKKNCQNDYIFISMCLRQLASNLDNIHVTVMIY